MSDPVNSVYPNGSPVDKGAVKGYESAREILVLSTEAEITAMQLPQRRAVMLGRSLYAYDATDTTSAHDGVTVLVDALGRRYRRSSNLADATAVEILDALDRAGLPATPLSEGTDSQVFGHLGGAAKWLTGGEVAEIIDGALGSEDWREGAGSLALSSRVDYLPANAWASMIGAYNRLVQMGDGTLRVSGQGGRQFNGDPAGNDLLQTRVLGVPADVTVQPGKFYMGASSGFFIDQNDYPWAWGRNNYGVLGDGTTTDRARPLRIEWFATNNFKVDSIFPIPSGNDLDCIGVYFLERGGSRRIAYLGANLYGASGDGSAASSTPKLTPVIVGGGTPLTDVTYLHASEDPTTVLARKSDGSWFGWGANTSSCLGISGSNFTTPQALTAMQGWVEARCGGWLTIALTAIGGGVRTAGNNAQGGLGIGNATTTAGWQTPTGLGSGVVAVRIGHCGAGSGTEQCAAIVEATPGDRRFYAWGFNASGSIGDGTTTNRTSPFMPVASWQGSVVDCIIGGCYTSSASYAGCFVRTSTQIYGTGYNVQGNLCNGLATSVSSFTATLGLRGTISSWAVVGSAAGWGLLVLTDKGCFSGGYNGSGACGVGTAVNEAVLQPLWVNGIMGPAGKDASPGWDVVVEDQRTAGTSGGSSIAGRQGRTLNTLKVNGISAALLSNQLVLAAGTYDFAFDAPAAAAAGAHKADLYDYTNGAVLGVGSSEAGGGRSAGTARATFTAAVQIGVRHYTTAAVASTGLGAAVSSGDIEVFTRCMVRKVA